MLWSYTALVLAVLKVIGKILLVIAAYIGIGAICGAPVGFIIGFLCREGRKVSDKLIWSLMGTMFCMMGIGIVAGMVYTIPLIIEL